MGLSYESRAAVGILPDKDTSAATVFEPESSGKPQSLKMILQLSPVGVEYHPIISLLCIPQIMIMVKGCNVFHL